MKVLWFVNVPLPDVLSHLGWPLRGTGWWLSSLACEMAKDPSIKLTIANCNSAYKSFERFESGGIEYWIIPAKSKNINGYRSGELVRKLAQMVNDSDFEIIDVHGSEYIYGQITPFVKIPVIITIQLFMTSVVSCPYGNKSLLGVLMNQIGSPTGLKDVLVTLYGHLSEYMRYRSEKKIFKNNYYYIGRTSWDKAVTYEMSKNVRGYYICWEVLRPEFYTTSWDSRATNNFRIFACSRCTPEKGFHDLIRMISELKNRFAQIELRLTADASKGGWGWYLTQLAKKLGVSERVKFLGYLSGTQIAEELKNASIYAHATYLDNSPNSLAEAMCIGSPCVASTTGGIASMIENEHNGLLFETGNRKQLLEKVSMILSDKDLAQRLGSNARQTALERHNPAKVVRETLTAYDAVLQDWKHR